jgi:hypothetical protein
VSLSDERLARNEILFREINERLDEMSVPWAKTTDYLCECSELSCSRTIELRNEEYERVRAQATVFVVVPGHERTDIEKVIEENDRFRLVQKVVALEEIVEQDPRRP